MRFFRKQLLDILEWEDRGQETLVFKYPMADNEIQNGGKLVVRQGQCAIFVNEGKIADVFLEPGTYTLNTQTLPLLTNLKNWSYGFKSPFKSDVYYISTRVFIDQKWGTPRPILIPDPKFEQVEIKAFGTFAFRVMDPALLLIDVTSTNQHYTVEQIQGQLRSYIVSNFSPTVASQGVTAAQLVQNYQAIDQAVRESVNSRFQKLGLEMTSFVTKNISLQKDLLEAMRQRSSVNILGNIDNYSQIQKVQAMKDSVNNPGMNAMAQAGMGMGMGMGMGGAMARGMQPGAGGQFFDPASPPQSTPGTTAPPGQAPHPAAPLPTPGGSVDQVTCSNCQAPLPGDAQFCSRCGTKVPPVVPAGGTFCTRCGQQNDREAAFCSQCGNKLG